MTNLTQWDPFTDLRQAMDQLFDQGFARPWRLLPSTDPQAGFPVDIWETEDALEVKAALPGLRPDDVEITFANGMLTIKAEHRPEAEEGQRNYHRREISYGSHNRSFSLPVSLESDKAEARFENGMLHLRLPKAESVRPKQIKISAGSGNSQLLT
jgi:HSP20 family protein